MNKILDNEFRKGLYKSLCEAGYEKTEAQQIVGVKYSNALKDKVNSTIASIVTEIENNQFNQLNAEWLESFNNDMAELQKMKEFIG